VLGHEPGLADVFRHIHAFSVNTFDRMVAWSGRLDDITFEHEGSEHLFALAGEGRGAILVGAHLGSFDMMRMLAEKYGLVVNVLMFTRHATRINAFLEALDPERRVRVLEIQPGSMQAAFAIKQCVERGEFVGILADRIHPGGRDRPTEVDFLGRATVFPLTPFLLGALLGCPMLAASCLRLDDGTYLARVRPLGTGDLAAPVARRARAARARAMLEDWVGGLERECLRAPLQWFNFFDYWQDREAGDA
jgi:predicted LPLAT superfamily acyltransferase